MPDFVGEAMRMLAGRVLSLDEWAGLPTDNGEYRPAEPSVDVTALPPRPG